MIPAILIGLTGVLVDDAALHRRTAQLAANRAGLTLTAEDYRTFFTGRTGCEGFRAFLTQRAPNRLGDIDDLLAEKARSYRTFTETGLRPCPGAVELVMALCRTRHPLALGHQFDHPGGGHSPPSPGLGRCVRRDRDRRGRPRGQAVTGVLPCSGPDARTSAPSLPDHRARPYACTVHAARGIDRSADRTAVRTRLGVHTLR